MSNFSLKRDAWDVILIHETPASAVRTNKRDYVRVSPLTDAATVTPDNDPHEEHDFGAVTVAGKKLFWKIDYYDLSRRFGSEDPADPAQTARVMTIMLAEEY